MSPDRLTDALKSEAIRLGFDLVGACRAVAPAGINRFRRWLAAGYAGQMRYLADRADAYRHPQHVLAGVESILMLGTGYRTVEPRQPAEGQGKVSRYAWGADYHELIHRRLRSLVDFLRRLKPGAAVRGVVDTAPLLEREFAQLAGLGWIGKNTLLLNRRFGSWVFLAALLTSEPLAYDQPFETGHCGTCRACLDACPTGALVDAYQLDARRCISYLTIELRSACPTDWREHVGPWLFGCDLCQEVCPWNRRAQTTEEESLAPAPGMNPVELAELFGLDESAFRARFGGTSVSRAGRAGLLRNAAIVLGNRPDHAAWRALARGLNDADPVVRGSCAWALGRYDSPEAEKALRSRLAIETDVEVRGEIESAIR